MRESRSLLVSAEVGLAAVTLASVLGMSRLFDGGGWLLPLSVNAAAAHLVAALCRRRGINLPLTGAVMAAGAALVGTWSCYWSTTAAGLPTGATWSAVSDDLSQAWTLYQDVVAPAPVETGFVLASGLALWCVAYVSDWAAFRLWVPFEATLPAGTLFLFTALLGSPRGRGWAVGLYAATVVGFLLVHRTVRQDGSTHWVSERRAAGHRSLLTAGAALGVVAVVAGTVLGPSLPGADSAGVIDPRALRNDEPARLTISPLVDIRARLVDQASTEVFRVRSPQPSYWRLTSLDRFDGRIWSSSGSYGEADGELPRSISSDVPTETFEQVFSISALAAIWLPTAYEPRALEVEGLDVLYDEDSSTLIVDREAADSDGLVYQVTSASPRATPADLSGSGPEVPDAIRQRYLELPDDFSPRVHQEALSITDGAASPYEAALALQEHLRTFTYDLTVSPGHSGDDLEHFLFDSQRGYCEQFAGAFAAMARSIGIPARVAVGFTEGEIDPSDPTLYHVRGEHAHAWPEVFLAGAGWVSGFEPTPGRGMPFAEAISGVQPAQAAPGNPEGSDVAPSTTAPQTVPTLPTTPQDPRGDQDRLDTVRPEAPVTEAAHDDAGVVGRLLRPLAIVGASLVAIALLYAIAFPLAGLLLRRRRRARATTPRDRVALAWTEAVEAAGLAGFEPDDAETVIEQAHRLVAHLPTPEVHDAVRRLAGLVEVAAYSADGVNEAEADDAVAASAAIATAARDLASGRARLGHRLDPRPVLRRWRHDRGLRQRRITTTVGADLEAERQLATSGDRR